MGYQVSTHEQSETVQVYYPLRLEPLNVKGWDDDDYFGPFFNTPEEERQLLPDLMLAFNCSYQSRNEPHYKLPDGVKSLNYFMTLADGIGLVLCVNYGVEHRILYNTEAFKDALAKASEDIESSFDSWLNTHFEFTSNGVRFDVWGNGEPVRIVAPVGGREQLMFRWDSIKDIEHVEWALGHDNDAHNIMYHAKEHKETVKRTQDRLDRMLAAWANTGIDLDNDPCIQYERNRLAAYKWCRKHKKQFFYAKYC